ncbi:hypothetical protein [Enterococcus hulanensis]|uniref:hypothetical protein n=1 Tax=Enterococcus hulanensis TaxID=2559929 RepID=UPI0010F4ED54|nr:hypothetical protein [Enterococcus hulanensis]
MVKYGCAFLVAVIPISFLFILSGCGSQEVKGTDASTQIKVDDKTEVPEDVKNINDELARVLAFSKAKKPNSDLKFIEEMILEKDLKVKITVTEPFAVFRSFKQRRKIINNAQNLAVPIIGYHLSLTEKQDMKGFPTSVVTENGLSGRSLKGDNYDFDWFLVINSSESKDE